jgi:hypothetical protein
MQRLTGKEIRKMMLINPLNDNNAIAYVERLFI